LYDASAPNRHWVVLIQIYSGQPVYTFKRMSPLSIFALPKGSPLHLLAVGGNVHPIEWIPFYVILPLACFVWAPQPLQDLFLLNGILQLCLFVPVVQVPALLTQRMAYVDIGWPWGLVLLGANALAFGDGWWPRRVVASTVLLLHGGRMALGGLYAFGKMTKWTYRFAEDLPRYRYARVRFEEDHGCPARWWWIKIQHDTLQQCYANATVLAAPVLLAASNPSESVSVVEACGWALWVVAWAFENKADLQKNEFLRDVRARRRAEPEGSKEREKLRLSVLGRPPFDGPAYRLWTLCRHPNYFGEWLSWAGIVVAAVPSLLEVCPEPLARSGLGLALFYAVRFFYDCLVHWTGAGPAEHFSVRKRGAEYREYQRSTRCFWPVELPCFEHFRVAGWPSETRRSA
jgi:steroid 5-alpha reductase family enzyme